MDQVEIRGDEYIEADEDMKQSSTDSTESSDRILFRVQSQSFQRIRSPLMIAFLQWSSHISEDSHKPKGKD